MCSSFRFFYNILANLLEVAKHIRIETSNAKQPRDCREEIAEECAKCDAPGEGLSYFGNKLVGLVRVRVKFGGEGTTGDHIQGIVPEELFHVDDFFFQSSLFQVFRCHHGAVFDQVIHLSQLACGKCWARCGTYFAPQFDRSEAHHVIQ